MVERTGHAATTATSGEAALRLLRADRTFDAMLLDLVMPDLDGFGVLDASSAGAFGVPTIVMATRPDDETLATAGRLGAIDVIEKPLLAGRVALVLRNALQVSALGAELRMERLRAARQLTLDSLVAHSAGAQRALAVARRSLRGALPVLIEGESGAGKATLAAAIHGSGDRAGRAFFTLDCAAHPAARLESLLFGPGEGAVSRASGGTLVLAGIGALPHPLQARLAQGLDRLPCRVIALTTHRLVNLARTGHVREDLFYRLAIGPIYLPPLRERPEDLDALVGRFLAAGAISAGRPAPALDGAARSLLARHDWPLNLRELAAALRDAQEMSADAILGPHHFPAVARAVAGRASLGALSETRQVPTAPVHVDAAIVPLTPAGHRAAQHDRFLDEDGGVAALSDLERELIAFALDHHGGRMARAARALGIGRSTLYRKLREHGLSERMAGEAA